MAHAKISRSTKPNQQSEVKDPLTLGQHIAAVLAHPDTPGNLFDAMGMALCDLQKREIVDTPEFIQTLLDLNKKYGKPDEQEERVGVIVLTQLGANILGAIQLVQKVTGLSANRSRDLVKSIPKDLLADVDPEEAQAIKKQFAEIGCTVRFDKLIEEGGAA
jgi:ribosomal protein L7/L12